MRECSLGLKTFIMKMGLCFPLCGAWPAPSLMSDVQLIKVSLPLGLSLSYTDQPQQEKVTGQSVLEAAMSEGSEKAFVVTWVAYCLYKKQKGFCVSNWQTVRRIHRAAM